MTMVSLHFTVPVRMVILKLQSFSLLNRNVIQNIAMFMVSHLYIMLLAMDTWLP